VIYQELCDQHFFRTSAHFQDFSGPDFSFFIIQDFSGRVGTLITDRMVRLKFVPAAVNVRSDS